METQRFQFDALAGWALSAVVVVALLAGGVALRPREVFDQFLWKEFVGPVQATAHGVDCLTLTGWQFARVPDCAAVPAGAIVATPGLSLVAMVGYGVAFAFAVTGSVLLLRRQGLIDGRRFFFAVVPFLFVGGAVLAARDVFATLPDGAVGVLGYPLGLAFAGPLPYFLGVVIPTVVLSAAYQLSRTALVGRYEHASTVVAAVTFLGLFGVLMVTAAKPGAFLDVVGSVGIVLVATLVAVVSWATIGRLSPGMVRRIGSMGLVLFWAYLLNGLATVIRAEWATELGFRAPEQVSGLVILVANLAGAVLPTSLASMTRVAWPFVVLQVGVALFVASSFDRDIVRDDDLAVLLLLAVLAVALVPAISGLLSLVFGV